MVLPPYSKLEPKRTSLIDYEEMEKEFKNKTWSFLRVSEFYILGDVKATINSIFHISIWFYK
ncbi:hypothetical protein RhiirA5_282849 [Rhizophagus irregularis]|uniref:Uncharacterized protein n=1 Tax=Rhizophagus irregularis TaxID=588596 RepID=A0A2I1FK17_9GLOM|nr:hypothetical protein RhiirA5_282849 [Rhizophagus irregularis]PKC55390.1 hypothetical protein RhiirA1_354550 [Rhizophagus irregularis]PKY34717.1 hypothetical protein RhiirB3_344956 [Rhizophagus irregularis]